MKKIVILGLLFAGLLVAGACKKDAVVQYILTVTQGPGVSGEPQSGVTSYNDGETVRYNYTSSTGFHNLYVSLDGQQVEPSGSFMMNKNRILVSTVDRILYLDGLWRGNVVWTSGTCDFDDVSNIPFTGTQNDGNVSLVFVDVPVGSSSLDLTVSGTIDETGDFSLTGSASVTYLGVNSSFAVEIDGQMNGANQMTGTIKVTVSVSQLNVCTMTGTLTATKN